MSLNSRYMGHAFPNFGERLHKQQTHAFSLYLLDVDAFVD